MISPNQIRDFSHPTVVDSLALNWYGRPSLHDGNNIMINMIVAPIVPRSEILFSSPFEIPISIGQLPILTTGTVWREGSFYGIRRSQTHTLKKLVIDRSTASAVPTADLYNDAEWVQTINKHHPTMCLVIPYEERTPQCSFSEVVIPMTEVKRFYYGNSSNLLEAIMSGVPVEECVYSTKEGLTTQIDDSTWRIQLRQKIPDSDAAIAARFAFDDYARIQANAIYKQSIYPVINQQMDIPIIQAWPPFLGETDLKVRGTVHKEQFWVMEILQCSHPFPFEYLKIDRDNDGRSVEGIDRDTLKEYERGDFRQRSYDVENAPLDSKETPNAGRDSKPIKLMNDRFTQLDLSKIDKDPKTEQEYRSTPAVFRTPAIINPVGSTNQPKWGGEYFATHVYVQNIATNLSIQPVVECAKFDDFIPAIENLEQSRTITTRIRVLSHFAVNGNSSTHSFCPVFPPTRDVPFGFIDKRCKPLLNGRRQLVIVEICSYDQYFYIIDFQKKEKEPVAMILLYDEDHHQLTDQEISIEIVDFCKGREHFFIDFNKNGIIRERLKRSHISCPADLAERFKERIRLYLHNEKPQSVLND